MAPVSLPVLLSLALSAASVVASPRPLGAELFERQGTQTCRDQSCEVATLSGSTGKTVYDFPAYPDGDTQGGNCCIIRYFPGAKDIVYKNRPNQQQYCASNGGDAPLDTNPPGITSLSSTTKREIEEREIEERQIATCKPNILIFVRGTFEPGDVGLFVGNAVKSGLDSSKWDVLGVDYDNSLDGDYCLGLPGGLKARQILESTVKQCPNSKFAMGGYSQGAMVIRHALARASANAVSKVKNVLTYGDPFCGAPIGQYNGPIKVFCAVGDGVCDGNLNIGLTHLAYGVDVSAGVNILKASQA